MPLTEEDLIILRRVTEQNLNDVPNNNFDLPVTPTPDTEPLEIGTHIHDLELTEYSPETLEQARIYNNQRIVEPLTAEDFKACLVWAREKERAKTRLRRKDLRLYGLDGILHL